MILKKFGSRGRPFGTTELIQAKLHPHSRHIDIYPCLDRIEYDTLHTSRNALGGGAETRAELMKLTELLDQQRKADQTQCIRIGRDINFVGAENTTLRGPQNMGGGNQTG